MPSNETKRSRKRYNAWLKKRKEQNWSKMSYYDKVQVGDLVKDALNDQPDSSLSGLVIATIDTVDYFVEWGDTLVLWNGKSEPIWENCESLEVISESR
jgi:hypothetical protein